ncbi:MAG TPA: hypothetical protein VMU17_04415, partial [Elusimicrobiota bacterium]|nr:hypothetical protein [Elusimicrobiota bacterium]
GWNCDCQQPHGREPWLVRTVAGPGYDLLGKAIPLGGMRMATRPRSRMVMLNTGDGGARCQTPIPRRALQRRGKISRDGSRRRRTAIEATPDEASAAQAFEKRRRPAGRSLRFRLARDALVLGNFVFARGAFGVAFPDLLFNFPGNLVDGRVQVAVDVLGKKVGPAHAQANGAAELFSGGARVIVLQGHPGIDGAPIEMIQLIDLFQDVILDRLGQGKVMRRENQFHVPKMRPAVKKIQSFNVAAALAANGVPLFACSCRKAGYLSAANGTRFATIDASDAIAGAGSSAPAVLGVAAGTYARA